LRGNEVEYFSFYSPLPNPIFLGIFLVHISHTITKAEKIVKFVSMKLAPIPTPLQAAEGRAATCHRE